MSQIRQHLNIEYLKCDLNFQVFVAQTQTMSRIHFAPVRNKSEATSVRYHKRVHSKSTNCHLNFQVFESQTQTMSNINLAFFREQSAFTSPRYQTRINQGIPT